MNTTAFSGFYFRSLHYLIWLRSFVLVAQVLALFGIYMLERFTPSMGYALAVVAGMAVFTLWSAHRLRQGRADVRFFFMQLVVDTVALAVFLFFTGGATNPFAPLFLLPVVIAAATLPLLQTWIIAAIAVACYSSLMFFHFPLSLHEGNLGNFTLHIWGMWIGFLLAAVLVAYFVWHIGASLQEHVEALSLAREDALRTRQVLALGTLAAGTAHELGTPLSTVAVLARELETTCGDRQDIVRDLKLLRDQIDRCKRILARMSHDAGQLQADAGELIAVDRYLDEVVSEWKLVHPRRSLGTRSSGPVPAPGIVADRTLTQAITNVLDNAAKVTTEPIEMNAYWNAEELCIEVRDRGPGLAPEVVSRVGQPFNSGRADDGLGLGLFLARTTLDRLGGRIQFRSPGDGGSLIVITLPLRPLATLEPA